MSIATARVGELYEFLPKSPRKASDGGADGRFPFYTSSPNQTKWTDSPVYDAEALVFATGGAAAVHHVAGPFATSADCLVATPRRADAVHPRFSYHYLKWNIGALEAGFRGAGLRHVSKRFIEDLPLPLPPVREQRRISEILDRAEALRAKRRTALAQLDTLAQSIFLDMFGDPIGNPRNWPTRKLATLGSLDRGVSKHRPRNAPELLGGPYPFVQTGDVANCGGYITSYSATYSEAGLRQSKMWPSGTLCITIAANIAKTGILRFGACFPDSVVGFRSDEPGTVEFVRGWLSFLQAWLEKRAPESAQKNINLEILRGLDVPTPDIPLRVEFTRRIDAVESLKRCERDALSELDALFVSLQHRAFGGEL